MADAILSRPAPVPAAIASTVPVIRLARGLASEGLTIRCDGRTLVIDEVDAVMGIAWYDRLTKAERLHWHRVAGSAAPADAWAAFQRGES
ncbi:MAG: hypothetical protein ACREU3_07660 [Steroidobacteraceae bacterium]